MVFNFIDTSLLLKYSLIFMVILKLCLLEDVFGQEEYATSEFVFRENTVDWPIDVPYEIPVRAIRFGVRSVSQSPYSVIK